MKERIRYYHCSIDNDCIQEWLIDENDTPIQPTREKDEKKWFSIYRDEDGKEFSISPRIKTAIMSLIQEYLEENKKK